MVGWQIVHITSTLSKLWLAYKSSALFKFPPLIYSEIQYMKVYWKLFFFVIKYIKTCQREQVKKFNKISYIQIAMWTTFKQLKFVISRGGGKLEKSQELHANLSARTIWTSSNMIAGHHHYRSATKQHLLDPISWN